MQQGKTKGLGVSDKSDRATHERNPQAVSTVPVGIADAERFFPFTLYANETPHYTSSPRDFQAAFMAAKPPKLTWYAFSVTVNSPTDVEFVAYGMRDNYRGGLGKEVAAFAAVVSPEVTRDSIERRIRRLAEVRRADELEAREEAIVARYADELRAGLAQGMAAPSGGETGTGSTVGNSPVPEGDAPDPQGQTTASENPHHD